jgi:hypothetical protein
MHNKLQQLYSSVKTDIPLHGKNCFLRKSLAGLQGLAFEPGLILLGYSLSTLSVSYLCRRFVIMQYLGSLQLGTRDFGIPTSGTQAWTKNVHHIMFAESI